MTWPPKVRAATVRHMLFGSLTVSSHACVPAETSNWTHPYPVSKGPGHQPAQSFQVPSDSYAVAALWDCTFDQ